MRLGILTFHSQLNYGGVLQCWALKNALEGLGHEVVVVDRWLDFVNYHLRQQFFVGNIVGLFRHCVRGLLGCGDWGYLLRTLRTIRFVRKLALTEYHFYEWEEAPEELGVDLIVVGSDQVWHCGDWGNPAPYLLVGAPDVPAISYAASFGLKDIPPSFAAIFHQGLKRFSFVSCREREGVDICASLGVNASHVVDPTLLLENGRWLQLVGKRKRTQTIVCYFMSPGWLQEASGLAEFAKRIGMDVVVMLDDLLLKSTPHNINDLIENFRGCPVRICRSAGPLEFVRHFASARWVITDSFHALMFSAIFNLNVRFLRPSDAMRQTMFSRIVEFAQDCVRGPLFVDRVVDSFESFDKGEIVSFDHDRINEMRQQSKSWLENAIMRVRLK